MPKQQRVYTAQDSVYVLTLRAQRLLITEG